MATEKKKAAEEEPLKEENSNKEKEHEIFAEDEGQEEREEGFSSEQGGELTALAEAKMLWQKEKEELVENIKRKQADMDNLRRISRLEQDDARKYALEKFLEKLLPVIDNLERGLEVAEKDGVAASYIEGLEMIHKQLLQIFAQEGVEVICAEGETFDPTCHHAVMQVEEEGAKPGTVTEELQKGYRYRARILRPAMVKVCKE